MGVWSRAAWDHTVRLFGGRAAGAEAALVDQTAGEALDLQMMQRCIELARMAPLVPQPDPDPYDVEPPHMSVRA